MAKFKLRRPNFTLIELMIVVAILGIIVAVIVGALGGGREGRCQELCEGLRHRMVTVTPDACICEDPKTKDRQAHPMARTRYYGNGVWDN